MSVLTYRMMATYVYPVTHFTPCTSLLSIYILTSILTRNILQSIRCHSSPNQCQILYILMSRGVYFSKKIISWFDSGSYFCRLSTCHYTLSIWCKFRALRICKSCVKFAHFSSRFLHTSLPLPISSSAVWIFLTPFCNPNRCEIYRKCSSWMQLQPLP